MAIEPSTIRDEYITYVRLERNYSSYTVLEYEKDVDAFLSFIDVEGITDLNEVRYPEARLYITTLYDNGLSRATISRKINFKTDDFPAPDAPTRKINSPLST